MLWNELEVLLPVKRSADHTLGCLTDCVLHRENGSDQAKTQTSPVNETDLESSELLSTLAYYRGMRCALDVSELQWLALDAPSINTKQLRKECAEQYRRYRELFELEVAIARRQKGAGMALGQDWSGVETSLREAVSAWRFRLMLHVAGLMFRFGVPGALDLCDSAVFGIFRLVYLRPAA